MSIDVYLDRKYQRLSYNCYHFVSEVLCDLTGVNLIDQKSLHGYRLFKAFANQFVEIPKPENLCIVIFQRPRSVPHVGLFIRGNVLHIKSSGVEYQPLHVVKIGYTSVRFAKCRN